MLLCFTSGRYFRRRVKERRLIPRSLNEGAVAVISQEERDLYFSSLLSCLLFSLPKEPRTRVEEEPGGARGNVELLSNPFGHFR